MTAVQQGIDKTCGSINIVLENAMHIPAKRCSHFAGAPNAVGAIAGAAAGGIFGGSRGIGRTGAPFPVTRARVQHL